jgi:hypothetical protein
VIAGNNIYKKAMPLRHGFFAFVLSERLFASTGRSSPTGFSVCGGARLQIGAAITADEAHNPSQQHRANDRNDDADNKTVLPDPPKSKVA